MTNEESLRMGNSDKLVLTITERQLIFLEYITRKESLEKSTHTRHIKFQRGREKQQVTYLTILKKDQVIERKAITTNVLLRATKAEKL